MSEKHLADMPKLGEKSAQMLHAAGIHTLKELADPGAVDAYLKIKRQRLARISHQAAQDTDKTLAFWNKAWIVKNTACYSNMPITVQAGLRDRKLALHSNRSYGYAFRSRAALMVTNPAPAPVILVRNAGWLSVSTCFTQSRAH